MSYSVYIVFHRVMGIPYHGCRCAGAKFALCYWQNPAGLIVTIGQHHTTQDMYQITAILKEMVKMLEHPFGSVFWQVLLCKAIYCQDDGPNERILPLFAAGNVPDEGLLWDGTSGHCLRTASISPANLPLFKSMSKCKNDVIPVH